MLKFAFKTQRNEALKQHLDKVEELNTPYLKIFGSNQR